MRIYKESEVFGENPLCLPQIPHGLAWYRTYGSRREKQNSNHLNYGKAQLLLIYLD
jgi:hypothetical protein